LPEQRGSEPQAATDSMQRGQFRNLEEICNEVQQLNEDSSSDEEVSLGDPENDHDMGGFSDDLTAE